MQCIAEGFNQAEFIRVIPMLGITQQMIPGSILCGQSVRIVSVRPITPKKSLRSSTPMLRVTFAQSWFGIAAEGRYSDSCAFLSFCCFAGMQALKRMDKAAFTS